MNEITGLQNPLMQALGLAMLHSIWQGILLFCLLKMALYFVPGYKPGLRYRIMYSSLSGLFILFVYSFFMEWQAAQKMVLLLQSSPSVSAAPGTVDTWQYFLSFRHTALFNKYVPLLSVIYTSGILILCGKMIWEFLRVSYLRKQIMLPESLLQEQFIQLKTKTGIRNVTLALSEKTQVPLVVGCLKPLILLPFSLVCKLDRQQLETILLHELAHVKRGDYFWNILQMVMETLLFFNPAAWWLSSVIREEREHSCDDYVLQHTQNPLPYAHALLALEEHRLSYDAALAASGHKKSSLLNRIKRVTAMKQPTKISQRTLATITVLVLMGAVLCFATAFGQNKKETSEPKKTSKSASYSKQVVTVTDDKGNTKTYKKEDGDPEAVKEAMKMVPRAMQLAGDAVKEVDWNEIHKTVANAMAVAGDAMNEVDWKEIHSTVNQAMKEAHVTMKEVDWQQIHKEMENAESEMSKAMKEIDWEQFHKEMEQVREETHKVMKEVKAKMKDVDWEKVHQKMKEAEKKSGKSYIIINDDGDETGFDDSEARKNAAQASKVALEQSAKAREDARRYAAEAREKASEAKAYALAEARKIMEDGMKRASEVRKLAMKETREAREKALDDIKAKEQQL